MANRWEISEYAVGTDRRYENPFWDVQVRAEFVHKEREIKQTVSGFYDGIDESGRHKWMIRWTPVQEGKWTCRVYSFPAEGDLTAQFEVDAGPPGPESKGFLRADPQASYGFRFDNGDPLFLLGDTIYNLFGAHYCGVDVESMLRRRRSQGVNYIRARLQVSFYHPDMPNQWQSRDCWPWGGSAQLPDFMRLNLEYFRAVDEVVSMASRLGMGIEMILQGWLFEFPFNNRGQFVAEYEAFWNEYIVSRYAASDSVYIWCPANEYEFYPSGKPGLYNKESNRWLKRLSEQIRSEDPYSHPIGAHNWEKNIPLPERLAGCDSIEVYLVQTDWGEETAGGQQVASLCKGMEKDMRRHSDTGKVAICAEFGYERTEGLYTAPWHQCMDQHHTRRGQWRAGFSGYAVVHGFDNTWAAHMRLDRESQGTAYLLHYYRFMTETVRFDEMASAPERLLFATGSEEEGTLPLCLANEEGSVIAVYFPVSGACELTDGAADAGSYRWFNPRSGVMSSVLSCNSGSYFTPESQEGSPGGDDWVLLVEFFAND